MNPINKLQYDGIKFNYLENPPRWASHALRMLNKLAWAACSSFMWKKSPDITGQQLVGGSRGLVWSVWLCLPSLPSLCLEV